MPKNVHHVLTRDEIAVLNRKVNGKGTFEDVLRRLQKQFNPATQEIRLTPKDLEDIPHLAFDYKGGGFEGRLVGIFGRVLGPRLGRDDDGG